MAVNEATAPALINPSSVGVGAAPKVNFCRLTRKFSFMSVVVF